MAPEPPIESNDSPIRCHMEINFASPASDESDEEFQGAAEPMDGYEPLAMNPGDALHAMDDSDDDDNNDDTEDDENNEEVVQVQENPNPEPDLGLEMVKDVWNSPRPVELNFDLDSNKQELIKNTMQKFTLPKLDSAPEWMKNCTDEELVSRALTVIQKSKQNEQPAHSTNKQQ